MPETYDIAIIGGGISGISLAARLAPHASVAVLEAEEHLGMHATGRSAALLVEAYGPPEIRTLTGLSRAFFEAPPDGFSEAGLSARRSGLVYAGEADLSRLESEYELAGRTAKVRWLCAEEVLDVLSSSEAGHRRGGIPRAGRPGSGHQCAAAGVCGRGAAGRSGYL